MIETTNQAQGWRSFDFDEASADTRYRLMIGSIVPRPIALVTTVDTSGQVNAAPFSFFNCLSDDPPLLALGLGWRDDGSLKDTSINIRATGVFTVNIVSLAMAEAMHVCAVAFPPGTDELKAAGLDTLPGTAIGAPRIARSPVSFECKLHQILEVGPSNEIILGRIIMAHIKNEVLDADRLIIDPAKLDAIARLGGDHCATIRDRFEMKTPSLEDWQAR